MQKILIYIGFVLATLTDAAMFLTTTTYVQLAVAAFLYLPLIYFAFRLFPRKARAINTLNIPLNITESQPAPSILEPPAQNVVPNDNIINQNTSYNNIRDDDVEISDINRRTFLKIIGATGLSFFITSLFTKRAENFLLGKGEEYGLTNIKDTTGNIINPAENQPTDNYKISEVDYGTISFYGFMDRSDGWFIMKEDLNDGTYRYVKGDNNFRDNWDNREDLEYSYFNQVFPMA